jgi:endogenous inhibitor of DNA gyrase (YacG/DUF329 family)
MPTANCPICNAAVKPRSANTAFPFCTDRCKMVDLGKWLSEEYRVPIEEESDELDEGSSSEDASKNREDMRH